LSPQPLYYRAAGAEEARRRCPPDVLAECAETSCCCCRAELLAHAPALEHSAAMAGLAGQRLAVLCDGCADMVLEGEHFELRAIDLALQARITAWQTESN
jgi:hypothetical protein